LPRIFDNIELQLLPAIRDTLALSHRADFCVGYFNLRGWKHIDYLVERWSGGKNACCRLLVGMQSLPQDELHRAYRILEQDDLMDQASALQLKKRMADLVVPSSPQPSAATARLQLRSVGGHPPPRGRHAHRAERGVDGTIPMLHEPGKHRCADQGACAKNLRGESVSNGRSSMITQSRRMVQPAHTPLDETWPFLPPYRYMALHMAINKAIGYSSL